ncbi:MAG TPA: hypothetical protein VER55_16280 [Ardenticatenaceae bacterium]|nr:hypothetical protein [Ardenticatenaceae bacterium]
MQAGDLAREGLGLFTRHGDALYRVDALKRLGQVAAKRGQLVEARATLEEALALAVEIGDEHRAAECRLLLLAREP